MSQAFIDEYLGSFEPTDADRRLYQLAEEYERRCESYDQRVCDVRNERGVAMPTTSEQMGLINRHAQKVRNEIMPEVMELGFGWKEFKIALSHVQRTQYN